jgi:KAP family P-loop domain
MADMIERILIQQGIDPNLVSPEQNFAAYVISLRKINEILSEDLQTFPLETLVDIKDTLNVILNGFQNILSRPVNRDISSDIRSIMPRLREAYAHILTALTTFEENGRSADYFQQILSCKQSIFVIVQQLEGTDISFPSKEVEERVPFSQPTSPSTGPRITPTATNGTTQFPINAEAKGPEVRDDPTQVPSSSSSQNTLAPESAGTATPADSSGTVYVPRAFGGTIPITSTDTPADSVSTTMTPPVEPPTGLDFTTFFSRLNPPAAQALMHADAIRQVSSQSIIHMEHLIAGLFYSEESGPTQMLFRQAREPIDATGLVSLMAGAGRSIPVPGSYTPTILSALPPHSPHVGAALIAARDQADSDKVEQVDSRHLLSGALSVSDCSVIKALLGRGVDPSLIAWHIEPRAQPVIAGYTSDSVGPDSAGMEDLLGIEDEVKVLCAVIAATNVRPPLALGLFGEWGSGKSYFMRMMEKQIRAQSASGAAGFCQDVVQLWFNAWHYSDTDLWASLASEVFEQLSLRIPLDHTVETAALRREQLFSESASAQEMVVQAERGKSEAEVELRRREEQLAKLTSSQQTLGGPAIGLAFAAGVAKVVVSEPAVQAELAETERRVDHTLEQAAQALNYSSVEALKADVLAQKKALGGLGQLWTPLRLAWKSLNALTLLWLICGCVVAVILGLLLWSFRQQIVAVVVGVAAVVLALATSLAPAIGVAQKLVRVAGRAQAQVDSILKKEQAHLDSLVSGATESRDAAKDLVGKAEADLTEAKQKSQDIQRALDELRADHQLLAFIQARHASTDYTRRRGSIGKARDDFEKLAFFLEQLKKESQVGDKTGQMEATAPAEAGRLRIDRIILYIDDLDRCPEEKVMDVLQAIHLLLAFELFVVVVGVDPRWLLYTVKQRSPAFQEGEREQGIAADVDEHDRALRATPLNYLEKIFQIPFTLRPMTKEGFNRLIEELIKGKAEQPPTIDLPAKNGEPVTGEATEVGTGTDGRATDRKALSISPAVISPTVAGSVSKPQVEALRAENLKIEEWEQECIKKCFCLIPSPRATKRFVNIYRLLRAWAAMSADRIMQSNDQRRQQWAALLLLAILIGYSAEATEILSSLIDGQTPEKLWWDFVTSFARGKVVATNGVTVVDRPAAGDRDNASPQFVDVQGSGPLPTGSGAAMDAARWPELLDKLEMVRSLMPESESDDCAAFVSWAPQVARYSFRSGLAMLARRRAGKTQPEAARKIP